MKGHPWTLWLDEGTARGAQGGGRWHRIRGADGDSWRSSSSVVAGSVEDEEGECVDSDAVAREGTGGFVSYSRPLSQEVQLAASLRNFERTGTRRRGRGRPVAADAGGPEAEERHDPSSAEGADPLAPETDELDRRARCCTGRCSPSGPTSTAALT